MKRALLLLAACGGAQPASRPQPQLVVRDAGAEPRRIVRIEVPANADERAEAHLTLSVTRSVTNTVLETASKSVTYPELAFTQRWRVTERLPDGSARIRVDTEDVRAGAVVDPKVKHDVDVVIEFLKHRSASFRLLPDGTHAEQHVADIDLPIAADNVMVFPPTPIGVGAEWAVTQMPTLGGARWIFTYTYHLRALDDANASVELEVSAIAPRQSLSTDPRNSTTLTDGSSTASGQLLIPLHALVPTGGSHADTTTTYQLVRRDLRIETSTHVSQDSQIRPAP